MNRSRLVFGHMIEQSYFANKNYKRLKPADIQAIWDFLDAFDHLSIADREMKINRLYLDSPNKPKNWPFILELLSWLNSRIRLIEMHNLPLDARIDSMNFRKDESDWRDKR